MKISRNSIIDSRAGTFVVKDITVAFDPVVDNFDTVLHLINTTNHNEVVETTLSSISEGLIKNRIKIVQE